MANRKDLKKSVGYIVGDLIMECMLRCECVPGTNTEKAEACIAELIDIDYEFTRRISHTQPGEAKAFYRAFYKDFNDRISAVAEKIDALNAK